jgi:hypothetical protein
MSSRKRREVPTDVPAGPVRRISPLYRLLQLIAGEIAGVLGAPAQPVKGPHTRERQRTGMNKKA